MSGEGSVAYNSGGPSNREFFDTFAKIGLLSFGGPAGQIALMHSELVDEKQWIDEKRFLHALNFCMLLPGPEAMQLATYAGWLLKGVRGGLIAGMLFVLPGAVILTLLSMLYVYFGDVPLVSGMFFGLKAAVLAIVVQALVKVSKRALRGWQSPTVALFAFIALAGFGLPFPLVILIAATIGLTFPDQFAEDLKVAGGEVSPVAVSHVGKVVLAGLIVWVMPVAFLALYLAPDSVFAHEAVFFSKAAVVTFGGAYAVLTYVGQQAVEVFGWLKPDEMLTGLGLAETTPGPLILVLVFVGFVGAFRDAGLMEPLLSGLLGALVTLWVTFVPCFIWIFLGAPFLEKLRANRRLTGGFAAITAAVVGVIANLSLWFALHVLFTRQQPVELAGASISVPVLASIEWPALLIAVAAGFHLFRGGGLFVLLVLAVLAGLALQFAG